MKQFFSYSRLIAFFTIILLSVSCKQTDTVVVNENPTASAPSDTSITNQMPNSNTGFHKLVIGTYQKIDSMDPLFADNLSAMRINQLVYEGLVRLDSQGSVIPALAKKWSVSSDSLTFTFNLRSDVYFQDNDAFSTGKGRKFKADDVEFAFERMAKANVPPQAAQLFMSIKGFEPYFQEQHFIYNPKDRGLSNISGIKAPNDTTVVFTLENQGTNLLKKLATPLAVIYPKEAVGKTVDSFAPVGTGPFIFSQMTTDSTFIFAKNKNYYAASDVKLNRIDIRSSSEAQLLRSLHTGDVHLIPQPGPVMLQKLLTPDGSLVSDLSTKYQLVKADGNTEYVLRYNPGSNVAITAAQQIAGYIQTDTTFFNNFTGGLVQSKYHPDSHSSGTPSANINSPILITYSDDPFVQNFIQSASDKLKKQNITLKMSDIRTPTRTTAFFFTRYYPILSSAEWPNEQKLFSFTVTQATLQRSKIKNLSFNQYPWWFNVRDVTIPAIENLN